MHFSMAPRSDGMYHVSMWCGSFNMQFMLTQEEMEWLDFQTRTVQRRMLDGETYDKG